jgi:hypothetical protein
MVRVCTCESVLQWGFDETAIDGVPTLNQWVLLKEEGLPPSVVLQLKRRERKRLEGIAEQQRKDAEKGVRFNTAMEETLAENGEAIEAHLEMLGHAKGNDK